MPCMAGIAEHLTRLLKHKVRFEWSSCQEHAFEKLKHDIINSVFLAYPDFNKRFIVRTDASDLGIAAVIAQKDLDGHERPISFISRSLSSTVKHYHPCEKECLGIVWALKKFEHYLDGQVFDLQTDNRALVWLSSGILFRNLFDGL